jgi:aminoglycoside phosphotransferase (APT) family kinase protein
MSYDLNRMKLLARGGQADIYEMDEGRILRVLRGVDPKDTRMLMGERAIMDELRRRDVAVPEVYEYAEVDGRPALAMQRISGPSMLDNLLRHPLGMRKTTRELARLHCEFLACPALEGLMEIRERVDYLIGRSPLLDDGDRAFVRELLAELPAGGMLLHGDFHPGNILTEGGRSYIIDWFGASRGDPVSDVAHTYLLCAHKPRIPSESDFTYRYLKAAAVLLGRMYLREVRARLGFGMEEFGKWTAVRAAERTAYGQPSELRARVAYVKACRRMRVAGVPAERWYKKL